MSLLLLSRNEEAHAIFLKTIAGDARAHAHLLDQESAGVSSQGASLLVVGGLGRVRLGGRAGAVVGGSSSGAAVVVVDGGGIVSALSK